MGTRSLLCKNRREKVGKKQRQDCILCIHDVPRIVYAQAVVQRCDVTLEDLSDPSLGQIAQITVAG